jgi:guanylate kinase
VSSLGTLYILSAPSGAGKTSLVKALVDRQPSLTVSVSHTTRAPRPGEEAGRDYHFVNERDFLELVEAGGFLEHAKVFDHFYGTALASVQTDLRADRDVVLEIDWQGAQQVRRQMPGCESIFIVPPSRDALETRLRTRGQDAESVIERRMRDAVREMSHYAEYDYLVVNDDFERALAELECIVTANRLRLGGQARRQQVLMRELLA